MDILIGTLTELLEQVIKTKKARIKFYNDYQTEWDKYNSEFGVKSASALMAKDLKILDLEYDIAFKLFNNKFVDIKEMAIPSELITLIVKGDSKAIDYLKKL